MLNTQMEENMKKLKNVGILFILITSLMFMISQYVYAEKKTTIKLVKYSDDFKNWVSLSNEEKEKIIQPKFYDSLNTSVEANNPIYDASIIGASVSPSFNLMNVIKNNLAIRDQLSTSACWAFSGLSSLETNLALYNYNNNLEEKVYDYSEKHANYATSRIFKDGKENLFGFNRVPSSGGQWYLIENYLTNGQGAIQESDMPFDSNTDTIDISEIENKTVSSQVYDTEYFDDYNELEGEERTDAMNKVKEHIQNYGSVFATIHGDVGTVNGECYDFDTGAKYCNDPITHTIDHAVSLIGWDDNYDKEQFLGEDKPKENGAWIARNSWGEVLDNGIMYISYEDCNVAGTLYGISKASDKKNYDKLYQYDELYPGVQIELDANNTFLWNVFDRDVNNEEYLTEISLMTPETYNCKVFVNPDGEEVQIEDLQAVKLKAGESEKIDIGYHTLEFETPVKLTGEKFSVVVEITGTRDYLDVVLEGKIDGFDAFDVAKTETNKCFIGLDGDLSNCRWVDLGTLHSENPTLNDGDSTIKAFTVYNVESSGEDDNPQDDPDLQDPQTPEEQPKKPEVKAENSNFDKAKCELKNIQRYTYTDSSSKNFTLIDTEITGITRNTENNDEYEYSYYLSTNKNMDNITDWVKISEAQTLNNKLVFKINSKDIKNYDEISKNTGLYIYIREKAVKGESESILVTKAMDFETGSTNIDTFVDNVKVQNNENPSKTPNNNQNNNGGNSGNSQNGGGVNNDKTGGQTGTQNGGNQRKR